MTPGFQKGKVVGGIILAILWVCCFLFIPSTAGLSKFIVILLGLLILFFYHLLIPQIFGYPSNPEATKLSWTAVFTIAWLALMFFYPFTDSNVDEGTRGAVAFFALVGGLGVCLLWIRFFSDEIVA